MNVTEIFLDTSIIKIKNVEDYSNIIFGKNYSDLINQGNNNYKFFIDTLDNETMGTFIVECQLNSKNEIIIGNVIICL